MQGSKDYGSYHRGEFSIPSSKQVPTTYKGYMCPVGLSLHHPAAGKLIQFSTNGCPTMIGKPWDLIQMEEAIDQGLHVSALQPAEIKILAEKVAARDKKGHYKVVLWDNIKDNPPEEFKIPPIAMIPHKS